MINVTYSVYVDANYIGDIEATRPVNVSDIELRQFKTEVRNMLSDMYKTPPHYFDLYVKARK